MAFRLEAEERGDPYRTSGEFERLIDIEGVDDHGIFFTHSRCRLAATHRSRTSVCVCSSGIS